MHRPVYCTKFTEVELLNISSLRAHELFRVTLPGGRQVAVDITRQQFGWKEFVSPWEEYMKHRVLRIVSIRERGIHEDDKLPSSADFKTHTKALNQFDKVMGECIDEALRARDMTAKWVSSALREQIDKDYGGLSELLALDKSNFFTAQESIVVGAEGMFAQNLAAFERRQDHRIFVFFVGEEFELYVALGEEFCKKMQKVWFTEEEYKRHKNSPATIRSIWKKRWDQGGKN